MKNKFIAVFFAFGITIFMFLLFERKQKLINLSDEQIKDLYIEVLAEDEKSVEKVLLEDGDAIKIKEMLLEEEIYSDRGFVFAEGGYRIVMDTGKELINFYPYCGSTLMIRVGDSGEKFISKDDEKEEELQKILDKYNKGIEGIWDWSNVND